MDQRENSTQLDGKYKLVVVVRIPDRQEVITAHDAKATQLSARARIIPVAVVVMLLYPSLNFPPSKSPFIIYNEQS